MSVSMQELLPIVLKRLLGRRRDQLVYQFKHDLITRDEYEKGIEQLEKQWDKDR